MDWYYYIALTLLISQLVFLGQMYVNYHYTLTRYQRPRMWYRPSVALIVPCKGKDLDFEKNITSFFKQDYENYSLYFVVAEESDAAYSELCALKERLTAGAKAKDIQILISGHGKSSSQKIHNLLYARQKIADDIEVMAFADSDICLKTDWLSHIVYPLHKKKVGAATGYRWFVPRKNNLATLALSATNAKIAQLLGNSRFNQAWGGSMAIRVDIFNKLAIDKIWQNALSDDLSLSYAVKKAGLKIAFIPACIVASYQSTTWLKLFEFGRRQFLITRISAPGTWWFGFLSSLYSILGLWAGVAAAVYAAKINDRNLLFYSSVPILFFACQMTRAIGRQLVIRRLLKKDSHKMRFAMAADILGFWIWSVLLLILIISSACGRTIKWRGIKYKLLSPTQTKVLGREN